MTKCAVDSCALNAYKDEKKCILHCNKKDYSHEWPSRLAEFDSALIDLIGEQVGTDINIGLLKKFLNKEASASKLHITFNDISFPTWDSRDKFNYTRIFEYFGSIHFQKCRFASRTIGDFEGKNTKLFFQDCEFSKEWELQNIPVLENANDVIYQNCTFCEDVCASNNNDVKPNNRIDVQLFNDCTFEGELSFYQMNLLKPIFNNTSSFKSKINELVINRCGFGEDAKLTLNNCHINKVVIEDTKFNSKFEFKENEVEKFEITNSNFYGIVDAYKTRFKEFKVYKSIFDDFTGFERCEFGEKGENSISFMPIFMYATFMSFVTFRRTKFHAGLDMEHTNLKEPPNYLNAEINPINSNRETFRIIKNSFDKIGNNIEANKFFVLEMQKYRAELRSSGGKQERFILLLNDLISGFGTNYLRPIVLIMLSAVMFALLEYSYESNALYSIHPPYNENIEFIVNHFNEAAKGVLPISKFLKEGMEFISLLFYFINAGLIWQTVVALKRHTRR